MFGLLVMLPRRLKWIIGLYLVLGISESFMWRWHTTVFQRIIDGLPVAREFQALVPLLVLYAALHAVQYLLIYLEMWPADTAWSWLHQWAKLRATAKISRIDYQSWQRLGTGQLVQTIENGADATAQCVMGFWVHLLRSTIPEFAISIGFLGAYDPRAAWLAAGAALVAFPLSRFLFRYAERQKNAILDRQEEFSRRALRAFMELVTFRIHRRYPVELNRLETVTTEIVRARGRTRLIQEFSYQAFATFRFAVLMAVIIAQIKAILAGTSTVGTLVAVTAFVGGALDPIHGLNQAYLEWKLNRVALDRFESVLVLPDDANTGKTAPVRWADGAIALDGVSFSYEDRRVLEHLSLTFAGGRITALAGATGAGKTTVVKLALGLLKPGAGTVRVDGQPLRDVDLESFYGRIAHLPQEPAVFDGTVRENLAFDHAIDDARLREALDRVRLGEWVRGLARGLDEEVGEPGIRMSGGERQRLALARAFLQDPAVIVMDEPTSALDSLTEELVTEHMKELFAGKTVIIIAHRLQTIRNADRIVVLDGGRVVQDGSFAALVGDPGRFRELWIAQTRSADPT